MKKGLIYKISAAISGISGIIILFAVIYPIVNYQKESNQKYPQLISPLVGYEASSQGVEKLDYTRASNWFAGGASREEFISTNISFYTISIPRLKIKSATVAIGGEDLSKNLVQYPGTALPGRPGNSVIFGHSVLPIFFNPEDYISIFSTLPSLKAGDEIKVEYDGVSFKYRVESLFEIYPSDIQVLEQDTSDSFLSLVTCVPPGDPRMPKRLIVRARIVSLKEANAPFGN